jgi:hypothetical protein
MSYAHLTKSQNKQYGDLAKYCGVMEITGVIKVWCVKIVLRHVTTNSTIRGVY